MHRFARDSARTPMQWDRSENAGFTTGAPWLSVFEDYETYNVASEGEDPTSVLNWYKTLSSLRREHSELAEGSYQALFPEDEQIFAYIRENDSAKAVILINFSTEPAAYDASCLENAGLLLSTGTGEKGMLAPLEAAIFEIR